MRLLPPLVLAAGLLGARADAQHLLHGASGLDRGIPDLCVNPTVVSTRSGAWSDPGTWKPARTPQPGDRVQVAANTRVTYDVIGTAPLRCVGVDGALGFKPDADTELIVGDLLVRQSGVLEIGTEDAPIAAGRRATVVIADRPIDAERDPEQFGTGLIVLGRVRMHGAPKARSFLRTTGELRAGQTSMPVETGSMGWEQGDRLIIPDSRYLGSSQRAGGFDAIEVVTLAQVSGDRLSVSAPLRHAHPGARNADGKLEFFPHIGNLTRNVVIRSQNPAGTRGHTLFASRADVDIRYASFQHLGRTTLKPLHLTRFNGSRAVEFGRNQIGRYAVHFHHLFGPRMTPANGYQYTFVGNTIEDASKWGITIHNTHYGLVTDNVLFGTRGAGIMTEDGSESFNVIERNFVVKVEGDGNRGDGGADSIPPDLGREGSGIWLRGPNNYVRENVVANATMYGYMLYFGELKTRMPAKKGDDPTDDSKPLVFVDTGVLQFAHNEAYAGGHGLSAWYVYSRRPSVLLGQRVWHVWSTGYEGYPTANLVLDGWVIRGDPTAPSDPNDWTIGVTYGDYYSKDTLLVRADIQNMRVGIRAALVPGDPWAGPGASAGISRIEDSLFRNWQDVSISTPYFTGGGPQLSPRTTVIRNSKFVPPPGGWRSDEDPRGAIVMTFRPGGETNVPLADRVLVYDFNQVPGDNFELFYLEQAPEFVVPRTSGTLGALQPGVTNRTNWERHRAAIAGQVAPCSTRRPDVIGFVCPSTTLDPKAQTPSRPAGERGRPRENP
jgi:hypothetical protein